jgi:hypothetical protein
LTDEQIAAMRDPRLAGTVKLPTIEHAVKAGGFLAGRPENIIEALKAVEKRYPGLDRVICATPLGTPRRPTRRPRPLPEGGNPRLPRHQDRRRGAVDPRYQPRAPVRRRVSVAGGLYHQQRDPPNIVRRAQSRLRAESGPFIASRSIF